MKTTGGVSARAEQRIYRNWNIMIMLIIIIIIIIINASDGYLTTLYTLHNVDWQDVLRFCNYVKGRTEA
jgi:hypothetical protein